MVTTLSTAGIMLKALWLEMVVRDVLEGQADEIPASDYVEATIALNQKMTAKEIENLSKE